MSFFEYILVNKEQIMTLMVQHINLVAVALFFAVVIGVPVGIFINAVKILNKPIMIFANTIQAVPSIALLGFAIPFLGIGSTPAVIATTLYSLLPIIKNTSIGISGINPQTIEAAKGIGLNPHQVLFKIQLPIALPFIMAGIRISAVTAVGLMTMAAFVGAGGLGFLVFSGIKTVNNYQILAGAIPACILALTVDYAASLVEKTMSAKRSFLKRLILRISFAILLFCFVATLFVKFWAKSDVATIAIGGKDFTEQQIIVNMLADLIEDRTELKVERKVNLGGTQVCQNAIIRGDIDIYIEYTGTAYGDILKYPMPADKDKMFSTIKSDFKNKYGLVVLNEMGFNNTYALVVRRDTAQRYNLKNLTELSQHSPSMLAAFSLEFLNREDGMPGLGKDYHMKFKHVAGVDGSPRYLALIANEVETIDAYTTDGLLKKFNLVILEDDKSFFPPYFAIPLIRKDTYEKYPYLEPIINQLGNLLNNDIMMDLNYQVDEEHKEPDRVAREFLISNGLLERNQNI